LVTCDMHCCPRKYRSVLGMKTLQYVYHPRECGAGWDLEACDLRYRPRGYGVGLGLEGNTEVVGVRGLRSNVLS
jgi:hypothetical protein